MMLTIFECFSNCRAQTADIACRRKLGCCCCNQVICRFYIMAFFLHYFDILYFLEVASWYLLLNRRLSMKFIILFQLITHTKSHMMLLFFINHLLSSSMRGRIAIFNDVWLIKTDLWEITKMQQQIVVS